MQVLKTVIVDDERLARKRICHLLESEADIAIVGEYPNGRLAAEPLRETRPDLLFLDVQMPGVDGFELLHRIGGATIPAVIFVTAYEQYAVRAFDVQARDYLLKPYEETRFRAAVQRAREAVSREVVETVRGRRDAVLVRSAGKARFVEISEIDWIESADNYARLHVGRESHLMRETLATFEAKLPLHFVRIHRSTIVNTERILELQSWFHGDYQVVLKDGQTLRMSRTYRERVQDLLGRSI